MATTGISALGNDPIIAIAALSSKDAATAEYTTGGNGLQELYNTVHDNSASWTGGGAGVEYSGITPIVVNNTSHQISADTWDLAIGDGLSAVEDAVNKQTIISVTGGGVTYTAGNMISLANDIVSVSSQAGITDIVSATALPLNPVSSVLYLIPEA